MKTLNRISHGIQQVVAFQMIGAVGTIALDAGYAYFFGIGRAAEGFFGAMMLYNSTGKLMHGSALQDVFLPIFMKTRQGESAESSWTFLNSLINLVGLIGLFLSILFMVAAPWVTRFVLPGFDAARQALAISLFRWLAPTVGFGTMIGLMTGVLQADRKFWLPEGISNVGVFVNLIILLALAPFMGIMAAVIGLLARSVVTLAAFIWVLRRNGFHYRPVINFRDPRIFMTLRTTAPYLMSTLSVYFCSMVAQAIYSYLPAGGYAVFRYASNLFARFVNFLIPPLSIVTFPEIIERTVVKNREALNNFVQKGIRLIAYVLFPLSVALALLREPITRIFLKRGSFDESAAAEVAAALGIMAVGLFAEGLVSLLNKIYVALHQTFRLALVSAVNQGIYLGFAALLIHQGVRGLSWAGNVMIYISCSLLLWGLRPYLSLKVIFFNRYFAKLGVICALAAAVGLWISQQSFVHWLLGWRNVPAAFAMCFIGVIILAVVHISGRAWRISEAVLLEDWLLEKTKSMKASILKT